MTASRLAAENELGGAAIAVLESAISNRESKYFMIKVFIKYDFIHDNTHKIALVMSKLTISGEGKVLINSIFILGTQVTL
ncbi:hypothetical protein VspSTUT16_04180 [Vibrio sp. STUT-A16]|nr:hypothetical protein VspSTUT16_04180 [Vibrio sp. STUT-A16]